MRQQDPHSNCLSPQMRQRLRRIAPQYLPLPPEMRRLRRQLQKSLARAYAGAGTAQNSLKYFSGILWLLCGVLQRCASALLLLSEACLARQILCIFGFAAWRAALDHCL